VISKAKYVYWYVGGIGLWAGVFYFVGHRLLHWSLPTLAIAYLVMAIVLGLGQIAMYRCEGIVSYRARVRRRMGIAACSMLILWTAILAWLLVSKAMAWDLALTGWVTGLAVACISFWLAYNTALKFRLGSRPEDHP